METSTIVWWSVALGLGFVVLLVAVWLLETFTRRVERIELAVERIWLAGKQVAGNTATTWMLSESADRLDVLTAEAQRHSELFGSPGG